MAAYPTTLRQQRTTPGAARRPLPRRLSTPTRTAPLAETERVLSLQRQAGNQAVAQLLGRGQRRTPARPRPKAVTVQRHSSWEHRLIGDLTPADLATLGASRDLKGTAGDEGATVSIKGQQISKDDVIHVLKQEIRRLSHFRSFAPPDLAAGEKLLQDRERQHLAQGEQWQVRLVQLKLDSGHSFFLTYGEMNTLADYYGSVKELKKADPKWLDRLIRGVREDTIYKLMGIYAEVTGMPAPKRQNVTTVGARVGITGAKFRSAPTRFHKFGKEDALRLGGLHEVKLMGAGPLGTVIGKKKPMTGGDPSTTYGATLARNACHFAPESWHAWAQHHQEAEELARESRVALVSGAWETAEELANEARVVNGFGDHFLQDSYAAGHLINKTKIMQFYVRWLDQHRVKWDANLNKRWRRFQAMAYGQPGIADPGQYDKKKVGTTRTITDAQGKQVEVPSARNPQAVENLETTDWTVRAKALGLQVPAELGGDTLSGKMLLAWARWAAAKGRMASPGVNLPQLYNIGKAENLTEGAVYFTLWRLFQADIVRFASYDVKQRQLTREEFYRAVRHGRALQLRAAYIPTKPAGSIQPGDVDNVLLGVTYQQFYDFMRSSFVQKATNNLHDYFCKNGLEVYPGSNPDRSFKVYGDQNMLQAGAAEGLRHSGRTAKESRERIEDIIEGKPPKHTLQHILRRLPDTVKTPDGQALSLAEWHKDGGALWKLCTDTVFPGMIHGADIIKAQLAPGVFGRSLGVISAVQVHSGDLF